MMIVTVALPVYNAQDFLDECFESIFNQKFPPSPDESETPDDSAQRSNLIEVSVYDDSSTDSSPSIIEKWKNIFASQSRFSFIFSKNESGSPKGVGYGRNQTIKQSRGQYICFCDADDVMESHRIATQLKLCVAHPKAIIGSKFRRRPEDSTRNFTKWANSMNQAQLQTQIYLSFGPTVVMPTWFCERSVYDGVEGGFDETGKGVPEDLIFFYKHLEGGGSVVRADEELVVYRYHPNATTFSVTDEIIWSTRLERLERKVLAKWSKFSIWNAGKLGRRFYRSLSKVNRDKVACFCDVDNKKIEQKLYHPYPMKTKVPIVHVDKASPPFVICVKTELTWESTGDFRVLLDSLHLQEGVDYFYFN